ncbi:hypothetical protein [Chengkuizengella sediminis]|uniref:hypothetical protein n=1 Tax=Chengkuizengella sediminis TaxID=1885917 RepID=UPI00138A3B54|nr:hypothetical protein [Chengkuizengella sediminis]NDI35813.1 hypothetical protein [Chengkuizengella sediminis]
MGPFDESICDCCVCPMQCVLKQLAGRTDVTIFYIFEGLTGTLTDVDNFIAALDISGSDIIEFPISNICAVQIDGTFDFKLKPIQKSGGECSCTEESTTNLAKSKIGASIAIIAGPFCEEGSIIDVGEGIVFIFDPAGNDTSAVPSCKIQSFGRGCG